ncbi:MAG: NfeD family protein [Candidatus Limnocylindrales bacterium]
MTDRTRTLRRLILTLTLLGLALASASGLARAAGPAVVVLTADGIVDSVLASYLEEGVAGAARDGAAAVVVRLNTPGGSLAATETIRIAFLEARVPVIVWVAPAGGRAASAGTFITLAANLAYMAPGTNIGAASPVDSSGADIPGTLGEKIRNDAIAGITATAEARGRPVAWAVSTVAEARSYPASEAVAAGAVDGMADSLEAVLAAANGRQVTVVGRGTVTLDLTGAVATEGSMNPILGLLHLLANPDIAFVLFVIGALGIAVELVHPNLLTGITGALAMILAFIGFGSLPLNVAGLLLLTLGFVLFVLETQIISHGLLSVAGIVCVALGASALYTAPVTPTAPLVQVAPPLIVLMTGTIAILMALVTVVAFRTRHMLASAGTVGVAVPLGSEGMVQAPLDPLGTAYLAGEPWSARDVDGRFLPRDTPVRLVGFEGLVAIVTPLADMPAAQPVASVSADRL